MSHYNEINVQKLYIACKSLEDFINEKVEAMNLGGKDYTAVLTRMSDQIQSLSNALQSADPDNGAVTLLKTLSDDFAVEAGKVEGTSYSEILTKINSLTEIVSVVKKKIAVPIRTSTDSALEKKTGDMYYDQSVKKFTFVTENDTGDPVVTNFTIEGHKHSEADVTGLTDKLNGFQTSINEVKTASSKIFEGMVESKIEHRDPTNDTYHYNAIDGGDIYLGRVDRKFKAIYSELGDFKGVRSEETIYVKSDVHNNASAGEMVMYFKNDGNLYKKDENGNESKVGYADYVFPSKDSGELWLGSDTIKLGGIIAKQGDFEDVKVSNDILLEGNSLKVRLNNLETGGSGFEGLVEKKTTDAIQTVYEYTKKEENHSIVIGSPMKPINMLTSNQGIFENVSVNSNVTLAGVSLLGRLEEHDNAIASFNEHKTLVNSVLSRSQLDLKHSSIDSYFHRIKMSQFISSDVIPGDRYPTWDYGGKEWAIWEAKTGEGSFIAHNGDTMVICNPGDSYSLNWYDEDAMVNNTYTGWSISVAGDLIKPSDIRLKTEIESLNQKYSSLSNKFMDVNFVKYKRKRPDDFTKERVNKYNQIHYGVIAQEIEQIFPEIVIETPSSYKTVEYNKLQMIANVVIQQQQKRIDDLEKRIIALENK